MSFGCKNCSKIVHKQYTGVGPVLLFGPSLNRSKIKKLQRARARMHRCVITAVGIVALVASSAHAFAAVPLARPALTRRPLNTVSPLLLLDTTFRQRGVARALAMHASGDTNGGVEGTATNERDGAVSLGEHVRESEWYLGEICKAWSAQREFVAQTELSELSCVEGGQIFLKREDTQEGGSFHVRGAANLLLNMRDDELRKGLMIASTGNAALGLAIAARKIGDMRSEFHPHACTHALFY
jgi:hypothetical protein